jgi:predicted enzyme related to lactoylglutathione lyase
LKIDGVKQVQSDKQMIKHFEIILYVADQEKSKEFYSTILGKVPSLDVPGMTEFTLADNLKLGLMPDNGIAKIVSPVLPHPSSGNGIPRCELYLSVDDLETIYELAIQSGAKEVSKITLRDWGDTVGYVADFDGHVIAFAKRS